MDKHKYHIGKAMIPVECKASVRPCPYGGFNMHYSSVQEAQVVVDDLNEQLYKLLQSDNLGFATHGDHVYPSEKTQMVIRELNTLKYHLIRLKAVNEKARHDLLTNLKENSIKKLSTDAGTATLKDEYMRNSVDTDKLKASGLYNDYTKDVNVSDHTQLGVDKQTWKYDYNKAKRFENVLAKYDGSSVDFDISIDEQGKPAVSEQTNQAFRDCKQFQDSIKLAEQLDRELKGKIMAAMQDSKVDVIKVGKTDFKYVPAHTEKRVDSDKLKGAGLYEEYTKTINVSESIMIKFK